MINSKTVEKILADATKALNQGSWLPPGGSATASAFEKEACRQIQIAAKVNGIDVEVKLVSGKSFPDIVFVGTEFGVEIKTAKKGWDCLGNSVMASTLIEGVKQVYLIFGSGEKKLDVRFSRYDDSVRSVEVTHSPRYSLDMEVTPDEAYFKQIGLTLTDMLMMDDPVSRVVEEARKQLKPGEHVWWISDNFSAPLKIRTWRDLSDTEKSNLISSAFALFPSAILKSPEADYEDYTLWLSQRKAVICSSMRDNFSAGGRVQNLDFCGYIVQDAPKILGKFRSHLNEIKNVIQNISQEEWMLCYKCKLSDCDTFTKRAAMWKTIVEKLLISKTKPENEYHISCIKTFLSQNFGSLG
jgi:hypothetical protein